MDQVLTKSSALAAKPKTLIEIDLSESPYKNDMIHNRWHPDIPIVAWVKPGDDFVIQTYDWTGGFIKNDEVFFQIVESPATPAQPLKKKD